MICASNKLLILSRRKVIFLLGMSLVGLLRAWPARLSADDWPQFRGPNCSGISQSSKSLPTQFSFEENVAWSAELGDGISSPVVANGRVFSTAMVSSDQLAVICHDVDHGTELWKYEVQIDDPPPLTQPNSYASSTPATDGKHLYVYVITRGLIALDILNGEQIWQLPVEQPCFIFNWGAAASPIVFEGMVYFNQDDDLNSFLLCVDAKTGKLRWRTDRPEILAGYAVPVICEFEGRKDLVVAGSGKLKGYDPRTGQELWTCNSLLRNSLTTPVVQHGMIYLSQTILGGESDNVYSKPLLQWKDTDQDGRLTKQEIPESFWERFDRGDANGDGFLIGGEIDEAFQSPGNMVGGGTIVQAIQGGGNRGCDQDAHGVETGQDPRRLRLFLSPGDRRPVVPHQTRWDYQCIRQKQPVRPSENPGGSAISGTIMPPPWSAMARFTSLAKTVSSSSWPTVPS